MAQPIAGTKRSQPSRETVEQLRRITPAMIESYLENRGFTLIETVLDRLDVWTRWYEDRQMGDEVMEVLAPTLGDEGTEQAPWWPANARTIGELSVLEDRNPNDIIQEMLAQAETNREGPENRANSSAPAATSPA